MSHPSTNLDVCLSANRHCDKLILSDEHILPGWHGRLNPQYPQSEGPGLAGPDKPRQACSSLAILFSSPRAEGASADGAQHALFDLATQAVMPREVQRFGLGAFMAPAMVLPVEDIEPMRLCISIRVISVY